MICADVRVLLNRPHVFRHCRDLVNCLRLHATRRANNGNGTVSIGDAIFLTRHHDGLRVSLAIIR